MLSTSPLASSKLQKHLEPSKCLICVKNSLIQVKSKDKTLESADLAKCFDYSKNNVLCYSLKYRMFTFAIFKKKERFSVCF